ncbi:MAG: VirD4-like conjugal transfer protein, CD1115 family [Bacilli bacterium]
MKFRAEPKDVLIFICFCIFLLYLIAIGVLNASSLTTTGEFYGFVPFEAFSSDFIASTLTFYILALVGIFVAVSSYFFDREKGFGFSTSKKDKGYSRWAKESEVKKQLVEVDPKAYTADAAGLVVINNGKKIWVDNGEAHNIVVGSTGSGKTQAIVFPLVQSLAKRGESMIITDPKGEIYENTANMLRERGYNIVILNFRNPQNGNAWNPLGLPYTLYKEGNTDKAIELLDDLAKNILYDENSKDPYWENAGADYFSGLALGLFEDAKPEEVNLNSMNLMSSLGEERFGGPNNNYIKEYFNGKDPSKPAYINASGTVFTAEETKQGVLSTFKQKVKIFSSRDNLSEMLSYSDFDMKEIGRKRTAVFMIVQDEKKTLHPLATIFIKQCYETLIDVAQESGGKLPYRTNFILDEFANMPPLKDVTTMVTAARSRLIRFTFIIQNYAQLTQVYGKENAETIKGNCNITYLISSELQALEEISKMCGEVKSKEKDKTASTPLVTVSDLQRLSQYEVISLRLRTMPFKTKLVPNFKMNWGRVYETATYPQRDKKEVKLFDIREFVKAKKQEKMSELLNGSNSASAVPFGMPNPFAFPLMSDNSNKVSEHSMMDRKPAFNVDELVKRIDAKIAQLEEEEKREKEAQSVDKFDVNDFVNDDSKDDIKNEETFTDQMYDEAALDDQFFDDFFSDE